jgi:hypothetical protein
MSNRNLLIFGAEAAPSHGPVSIEKLGSRYWGESTRTSRVSVEATAASLNAVIEQVSKLILAAKDAAGELRIAHVDVALVIAADGSVGLLGTDVGAGAKATLTVRLQL